MLKKPCIDCSIEEALKDRRICWHCLYKRKLRTIKPRACEYCGKIFTPSDKRIRFCSFSCGTIATSISMKPKELICKTCGKVFLFKGRTKKLRCELCRKKFNSKRSMVYRKNKYPNMLLGVGSGGAQWKENNHKWNPNAEYHGNDGYLSGYRNICKLFWEPKCIFCLTKESIDVHHINGDRKDRYPHNLLPLCKRCHGRFHARHSRIKYILTHEDAFYQWLQIEVSKRQPIF